MNNYIFIIAILLAWLPLHAAEPPQLQLQQADDYFQATLFEQAIPIYEDLLDHASIPDQAHVRLRLAQAYYAQKQYDAVISLSRGRETPRELLYLSGLAYKQKGLFPSAQQAFERYLQSDQATRLPLFEEVHYELGQAAEQQKQWAAAADHFAKIVTPGPLYQQAQLHLAKLSMAQQAYVNAQKILADLDTHLAKDEALHFEVAYYQGQVFYQMGDYSKAALYLEQAIPHRKAEQAAWVPDTLYLLGWSYLKLEQFDKAEAAFLRLYQTDASDLNTLALGQLYLSKWQRQRDPKAQQSVETILTQSPFYHSLENEAHSLILRAAAAPTPPQRKALYQQLTQPKYQETTFFGQGWYLRALNEYEEAQELKKAQKPEEAKRSFASAAASFLKAFDLLHQRDPALAGLALKYQAEAYGQLNSQEAFINAFNTLENLTRPDSLLLKSFKDPGEIFYLQALYGSYVAQWEGQDPFAERAEKLLKQALVDYPKSSHADQMQFLLGTIDFKKKQYAEAEKAFLKVTSLYPNSFLVSDAWFWAARSLDQEQSGQDKAKTYRRKVFENYPKSPYAAEAYFSYYPYRDYLQGDRAAIKHLQSMKERFPRSPFLIAAYYLIGMDNKRDRKSPEGKWIRKKNMNDAIEALQEAESIFDALYADGMIPTEDLNYMIKIRYRATLERALANLAIADESQGAKRQIFLEYAQEVLGNIVQDFKEMQHPLASQLAAQQAYPHMLEESSYWLAQAYSRSNAEEKAEEILFSMLDKYRNAKITRSYYLSRVWYDLGIIAMHRQENKLALQYFAHAEDAAKGKVLSTDQRIDLWIQESLCYKAMNDIEKAMLILSKAINDDAISSLRVKAMYLRADLYAQQGRHELARKQLEATSKKGGEWALKAKQKLDQEYGY